MENEIIRVEFRMKVDPGQGAEYIARRNPMWPELETVLRQHGVVTYSTSVDSSPDMGELEEVFHIEAEA